MGTPTAWGPRQHGDPDSLGSRSSFAIYKDGKPSLLSNRRENAVARVVDKKKQVFA